jgi:excisionase family DNA binding protein
MKKARRSLPCRQLPEVRMTDPVSSGRKLRTRTVCQRYDISRRTLYRLIAAGKLTARKLGSITLLDEAECDRLFNSLPPADIKSVA